MLPQEPEGTRADHQAEQAAADADTPTPWNAVQGIEAEGENPPSPHEREERNSPNPGLIESFKVWLRDPHRDKPKWTDVAIVLLTGGIVFLGWMQYQEMHSGGIDTRNLATAAQYQAQQLETMATAQGAQTKATIEQANRTKELAEQAVIQARAARSTAETSKEALISVQRAFIRSGDDLFMQTVDPGDPAEAGKFVETGAWWINGGNTTATEVINRFRIEELSDEPDGETFTGSKTETFAIGVFGPGEKQRSNTVKTPSSFYSDWQARLLSSPHPQVNLTDSSKKIFAWGWIAYRDIFNGTKPHLTEFCQVVTRIDSSKEGNATHQDIMWLGCVKHRHNCADDYCKDYEAITSLLPKK